MEWYQAVIVFAVAFAVAYCMVPVSKKIAFRIGAIDYPGYRRMNREPIPRCGGIALYVGLIAACFTMFLGVRFFDWDLHDLYILSDVNYIVLFIGVTTMFTVGLVDDITQLSPGVKLAGQIVAATVVTLSGITIGAVRTLVVGDYLSLGWIDYPLTVLYLVVFVNITNLIDGLDGLASGLVAIVAGGLLYLVLMRGSFTLVLVCLALIAVCLAFLRYNFFPASVFMGDSGSLLLGLVVGIVSVVGVVRTQSFVVMLVPLIIAAAPYIGRMVESSLKEVDAGVVEAAQSMGASTWQIIWKVLLPEAKPSLLVGAAISITTILGYSAMAGAVGAGGLGDIAIRYGYHRYQTDMMLVTVALLVIIVQLIQEAFMRTSRKSDKRIR